MNIAKKTFVTQFSSFLLWSSSNMLPSPPDPLVCLLVTSPPCYPLPLWGRALMLLGILPASLPQINRHRTKSVPKGNICCWDAEERNFNIWVFVVFNLWKWPEITACRLSSFVVIWCRPVSWKWKAWKAHFVLALFGAGLSVRRSKAGVENLKLNLCSLQVKRKDLRFQLSGNVWGGKHCFCL